MIIAVSGTPGTGKTEVARLLAALLDYSYIDLNELCEHAGLISGVDRARDAKLVDTNKLKTLHVSDNAVVDGHLAHYLKADVYVILRANPDVVRQRMEQRGWNPKKVGENVEAELIGVCSVEARELWDNVMDVDTSTLMPQKAARMIYNWIMRKRFANDPIDWTLKGYEP
ncbi:MAG: adenylate kinase family protein [Candidatus Aenigmatarchaeota archaeon]|nr:MAG: adenylate kinase family protein [Candidatus Aenigmarchaeota archaeon]